jgi:hypothetical protein
LNENGLKVFQRIFEFGKQKGLMFRWGSKGFSLNVELDTGFVGLFVGYPPNSVFKQIILTGFEEINKKVNNSEDVIESYRTSLEGLGCFSHTGKSLKWVIDNAYSEDRIKQFLAVIENVVLKIKEEGLKSE